MRATAPRAMSGSPIKLAFNAQTLKCSVVTGLAIFSWQLGIRTAYTLPRVYRDIEELVPHVEMADVGPFQDKEWRSE